MFLGHYAVGLASKRAAPRASLGILFAAPLLLDLLWPFFLLAGWERARVDPGNTPFTPLAFDSYPWSHSLLMAAVWAVLLALAYRAVAGYTRGAIVIALLVVSHWVLDALSHRPDMPIYPGGPLVGLGLWNSVPGTIAVEAVMFAAGVWLYQTMTRSRDGVGRYGWWAFLAFSVLAYAGAVAGPPPPNVEALAYVGLAAWIMPLWAWWIDRHRDVG